MNPTEMLVQKPGTVKLNFNMFPKLQDKYTEEEKKHMLILTGIDVNNSGLSVFQTTPELAENQFAITSKAVAGIRYPITKIAMEKEFVHAKLISTLNTASGGTSVEYCITTVFIGDKDNKNLRLADVYTGDPESGSWISPEQAESFAKAMNVAYYTRN